MRVAVVGAGVIGVAIADALAQRGAEAIVLDSRPPGLGASRASAGILAPYTEASPDSPLLPLGARSLALFDAFVQGAEARSGRVVDYARSGTLQVALSSDEAAHLADGAAWLASAHIEARWIEARDVASIEAAVTTTARGALLIEPHGFVGVRSLVLALVQSARLAGVVFHSDVDVISIAARAGGVSITCRDRTVDADAAVLAAGSWAGRIRVANLPVMPVRPVRGQLLHLRWQGAGMPSRVVWGPGCYTVPWPDGSLLVGATVEDVGFDERVTTAGIASLASTVTALLPAAAAAEFIEARAGLRPATPDGLPIIGIHPAAPGVCFATGHYRNGILLAPLTADLVTRLLLDRDTDHALTALSPARIHKSTS
jgi:glycine oxidase